MNDLIQLPLCFEIKNKQRELRHNLKVLPNGLMICKIKIVNPENNTTDYCNALIDTGAEYSLICTTVFDKLHFDKKNLQTTILSYLDGEEETSLCEVKLFVSRNNTFPIHKFVSVKNLEKRKEYNMIIGMDILQNFQLVYNGLKGDAWLDEL